MMKKVMGGIEFEKFYKKMLEAKLEAKSGAGASA